MFGLTMVGMISQNIIQSLTGNFWSSSMTRIQIFVFLYLISSPVRLITIVKKDQNLTKEVFNLLLIIPSRTSKRSATTVSVSHKSRSAEWKSPRKMNQVMMILNIICGVTWRNGNMYFQKPHSIFDRRKQESAQNRQITGSEISHIVDYLAVKFNKTQSCGKLFELTL